MAIIQSLQLDLNDGMTVLTGETGAGKSIIIDAISLLIGDRASTDLIRHHEEKALIEGIFIISENAPLKERLKHYGIPFDEELVIKRIIRRTGNGQIRVNGELISANQLRELGQYLVDIHVQHDTHRLFKPENNYYLIDRLAADDVIHQKNSAYLAALSRYGSAKEAFLNHQKNAADIQQRLDLMHFQKSELETAALKKGEFEALEERRKLIINADKLYHCYTNILNQIKCEGGMSEGLYRIMNETESLTELDENLAESLTQIGDVYYGLEEYERQISSQLAELSYNPEELEEIDSRLNELQQLRRKYRMEMDDLMVYYQEIIEELSRVEDLHNYENKLLLELEEAHNHVITTGEALNDERKKITKPIKIKLVKELQDLHLFNAQFEVAFTRIKTNDMFTGNYPTHGIYEIQFLLCTNKGEPLKPLHKVASGGELSRVMLALKTILNRGQFISTLIFDEIDTGVSGQVASSIGTKMKEIAMSKQVLCITHLPQVAALADYHIHVTKSEKENRTFTDVSNLTNDARVVELASMLSGNNITESALLNAKQLLEN